MNLILCYTPLQVLIAEKIIAQYPEEKFYGVMLCSVQNSKFSYYANRLKEQCEQFFSLHQRTDRIGLFSQIIRLKHQFCHKQFDKVFLASINDLQIQFILSSIKFNHFYTFDDGTANIVPSSVYYQKEPNTFIRRGLNLLLNNYYSVEKLKTLSEKHFTIYQGLSNIIEKTQFVDLFSTNIEIENKQTANKVTSILLGQPVYLEQAKNIALAEKVVKRFNIEYYLPHPREQYRLNQVNYIDTPLILEDYLAQHFGDKPCHIYTYFSSAVLNIRHPNIRITALRIDTEESAFIECYQLLAEQGVNIIDIREQE